MPMYSTVNPMPVKVRKKNIRMYNMGYTRLQTKPTILYSGSSKFVDRKRHQKGVDRIGTDTV